MVVAPKMSLTKFDCLCFICQEKTLLSNSGAFRDATYSKEFLTTGNVIYLRVNWSLLRLANFVQHLHQCDQDIGPRKARDQGQKAPRLAREIKSKREKLF